MYVLDCSIVETVNQQVVTMKINDVLKKLDIQRHNFVLLLSSASQFSQHYILAHSEPVP